MMFERFTERSVRVMVIAQEEARRLGHSFLGTEQFLLGLIGEGESIGAQVLKSRGLTLKNTRIEVENLVGRGSGNYLLLKERNKFLLLRCRKVVNWDTIL